MLPMLAGAMSSVFSGAGAGGGAAAATPDSVAIDTGDVTNTMGGAMSTGGSSMGIVLAVFAGFALLVMMRMK